MNKLIALKFVFVVLIVFFIKALVLPSSTFASQILFQDNFDADVDGSNPASGWITSRNSCLYNGLPTKWEVQNGKYGIKINGGSCVTETIPNSFNLNNINPYSYEVDMTFTGSINEDRNLVVKYKDPSNWYGPHFINNGFTFQKVVGGIDYTFQLPNHNASYAFNADQTYNIKTNLNSDHTIDIFINGSKIFSTFDPPPYISGETTIGLQASAGSIPTSEVWFDNVKVTSIDEGIDLNVPLLKQTNPLWGGFLYDSADQWAPPQPTSIYTWGCALTSAAMVFQYHKITKLPDNSNLNPGTLNAWLKNQPGGYIRNGLVNWLALARLSKLAKAENSDFTYDALEYKRAGGDQNQFKTDLGNNIPDILEEPGHFIVGKGIDSNDHFTINDPYYPRSSLADYSNSFLSLGRFIPSHSDLSYIMAVVDDGISIGLKTASKSAAGESFSQGPLSNDGGSGNSGDTVKILYFPQPDSGNYSLNLSSELSKNYKLELYMYDENGNLKLATGSGIVGPSDTDDYSMSFNKSNSNASLSTKSITFDSFIDDINSLCSTSDIKKPLFCKILLFEANGAKKLSSRLKKLVLKAMLAEITFENGRALTDNAFQILSQDINFLILSL